MAYGLIGTLEVVENKEDRDCNDGIGAGSDELMSPEKMKSGEAEEAVINQKKQDTIEDGEAEGDDNSRQRTFYVDLKSNAGSDIADGGFRHSIDADGLAGEGVLQQANDRSGDGSGDGTAARDGEEEDDDEGEIEEGKARKGPGKKGLQENGQQRHDHRDDGGEGVLLEFSA